VHHRPDRDGERDRDPDGARTPRGAPTPGGQRRDREAERRALGGVSNRTGRPPRERVEDGGGDREQDAEQRGAGEECRDRQVVPRGRAGERCRGGGERERNERGAPAR